MVLGWHLGDLLGESPKSQAQLPGSSCNYARRRCGGTPCAPLRDTSPSASASRCSHVCGLAARRVSLRVDEHAPDAVGDAHRLLAALGLDGEACDDLMPAIPQV